MTLNYEKNKKGDIKKAAINLFYKKGYYATSMSDIARLAGIRKSSIYHHYANKEDVLIDIYKTTMDELLAGIEACLEKTLGVENRIRAVISFHILFHIRLQKETIIADSELRGLTSSNYKAIIQMRDDYESKFQSVIQEGISDKIFAPIDVKVISYAIIAMCTSVCAWFKRSGRLPKEAVTQLYADYILKGLRA
jgi:AcrR family transcriptional regulator